MNIKGWERWEFNARGDLYHTQRKDLIFTPGDLEGLIWYHQMLADERATLRRRITELEAAIPPRPSNVVAFPSRRLDLPSIA